MASAGSGPSSRFFRRPSLEAIKQDHVDTTTTAPDGNSGCANTGTLWESTTWEGVEFAQGRDALEIKDVDIGDAS